MAGVCIIVMNSWVLFYVGNWHFNHEYIGRIIIHNGHYMNVSGCRFEEVNTCTFSDP